MQQLERDGRVTALEPMNGCGLLGALKCVAGMEGVLPMIHGPVSCSSGHRLAMLYAGVEPLLPTTCVEQTQVVLGCADRLSDAMQKAYEKYHPEILVVLLTCATAMTGEDYRLVANEYAKTTAKQALILDGSALAGDEVDICPRLYAALGEALGLEEAPGGGRVLALDGFAKTDYGFAENLPALKALMEGSLEAQWTPGLFAGSDVFDRDGQYRRARKMKVSLLWDRGGMDTAAPVGVRGSYRFLKAAARDCGLRLRPQAEATRRVYEDRLLSFARQLRAAALPVAIEGAAWYAYPLADYLKNDLGCRVLLSVDRAANAIRWQDVCDEFYEDTGRFELVELMRDFGARLVFGSSNVQQDSSWDYIPFYQPVWRVVDPMPLLGYDAAIALARRLLEAVV